MRYSCARRTVIFIKNDHYLYSYKSAKKASIEEVDYFPRREGNKDFINSKYENDRCLDRNNIQDNFSLMGSESINFIAAVATCRLIGKAWEVDLLSKISSKSLMDDLSSAWRIVDSTGQKPKRPRKNS